MKWLSFVVVLSMNLLFAAAVNGQQTDARQIIKKADEKMRGMSSYAQLTMEIIRPEWKREMSMKSWSKGTEYAFVYVVSPAKDKGTVSLKIGNEMWNWLPSIERSIKVSPSMMMQSWMRPPRARYSGEMNPDLLTVRGNNWLYAVGRLAPGVSAEQATAAFNGIIKGMSDWQGPPEPTGKVAKLDDGPPGQREGVFVDAAVAGLTFTTSSDVEGVTDSEGRYQYRAGDTVTFSLGDLELGTVPGQGIVTPKTVLMM